MHRKKIGSVQTAADDILLPVMSFYCLLSFITTNLSIPTGARWSSIINNAC